MAQRLAGRFGYPADDPFRVTVHPDRLDEPLRWKKPRTVFVCSMSDFFHPAIPFSFQCEILQVIGKCPQHTFMILTKRVEQLELWHAVAGWHPYPNLWLGVTAENQQRADERIPILLQIPAAVRFVSVEPMLEEMDLSAYLPPVFTPGAELAEMNEMDAKHPGWDEDPVLDFVIGGAETGPGARPMDLDWARSLRDQCVDSGVPFFFKKDSHGNHTLDGVLYEEYPQQ